MAKSFERAPIRASSDAWDDLAGALLAEDYFDSAVVAGPIAAANVSQASSSASGLIAQTHKLTGAAGAVAGVSASGQSV